MKRTAAVAGSVILGTAIGGILLWLVVRRLELRAAWDVLAVADWAFIGVALVAMIAMWIVKSLRWIAILRGVAELRLPDSLAAVIVGAAGNVVVSHAGEALRVLIAGRRCGSPTESLLTSIAIEHAFDCLTIFVMVSVAIFLGDSGRPAHIEWILGLLALGAGGFFIVLLRAGPHIADRLASESSSPVPPWRIKLAGSLRRIVAALQLFNDRRQAIVVLAWSALMWVCVAACIYLCMRAVAGTPSFSAAILVLGVHTAALLLPAPPAKVGLTQASFALALAGTALTSVQIFAASVIYNVVMALPVMLAGLIVWHATAGSRSVPHVN